MAAYLLISVFPQLPLVIYLAFVQPVLFPIDPIMGSLMFIFLVGFILSYLFNKDTLSNLNPTIMSL